MDNLQPATDSQWTAGKRQAFPAPQLRQSPRPWKDIARVTRRLDATDTNHGANTVNNTWFEHALLLESAFWLIEGTCKQFVAGKLWIREEIGRLLQWKWGYRLLSDAEQRVQRLPGTCARLRGLHGSASDEKGKEKEKQKNVLTRA